MKTISFTKMSGSGNDFIVIDTLQPASRRGSIYRIPSGRINPAPTIDLQPAKLAKQFCRRRLSIGADGLLLIEPSRNADFRMRIFNPDGKEAEMCGNGARCIALWAKSKIPARGGSASGGKNQKSKIKIETKSGIIEAKVIDKKKVRIKLVNPQQIRLNFNLEIGAKNYKANFINTGVPHVVIFSDRLKNLDVKKIGSAIRHHHNFKPGGTNADFAKIQDKKNISIRTYERGVEEETLACGTGVAAAVLISAGLGKVISPVNVRTKGKEVLKVYFEYEGDFKNVWLEGGAKVVYRGKIEQ